MTLTDTLKTFHTISGMTVAVYDAQFRCTHSISEPIAFCSLLHKSADCFAACVQSDDNALRHVKDTGVPYVYRCPFGLFEAIYPIREQETIIGYLIVGPAVCKSESDTTVSAASVGTPHADEALLQAAVAELPHYEESMLSAICNTLSMLVDYIENHRLLSEDQLTLGRLIKQYVKKNLTSKITLQKIAEHLHCSTVTLTETFRKEYGITIMQYVLAQRMKRAELLLRDPTVTVTDAAEHCGFPDVEYFSKCFKEIHGIPPSVWRDQQTESSV